MTDIQKQWLKRILAGGGIGVGLVFAAAGLIAWAQNTGFTLLSPGAGAYFGSRALAVAAELCAAFGLGAAVGVSTLPFDGHGPALARRSLLHYLVTGALFLLLGWSLRWFDGSQIGGILFLLGLYTFLYLVVWLVRYLGWRAELDQIRRALGLAPPPASPLRWRESLPYLLLLAAFFLLMRPLAEPLDAQDLPLLRALFLPWLAYPFVALVVGWALGWARGFCPLLAPVAFVSFLPALLWPNVPYDWRQGAVYALLALGAHLAGSAVKRWKGRA